MNMKLLVRISAFTCAAVLIAAQTLAWAQQLDPTQPGALYGYTATDQDSDEGLGHNVFRINLTNGVADQRQLTNVGQELEGILSADDFTSTGRSELFGVAEAPDGTGPGGPSVLVNLTEAATGANPGVQIGTGTGITFGTEAGAAYDWINPDVAYVVASDDRNVNIGGQQYPATRLYTINLSSGTVISTLSTTQGLYLDGLAYGADGELYATDARLTDSLYRYNFSNNTWEQVGEFNVEGEDFNEDSGLATYRGVNGDQTQLYMVTEGEGDRVGRLWTVDRLSGQATFVAELRIGSTSGPEAPEDLEGFDIPYLPLEGQQ